MAWRVLSDGPMIETSGGVTTLPGGGEREITQIVIARAGQVIDKDLSKSMKDRYEAGDDYVRSIVEYGEMELQTVEGEDGKNEEKLVFVPKGISNADGEEVPETDEALVAANASLRDEKASLEAQLSEAKNHAGELEAQVADLTNGGSTAVAQIEALQTQVNELTQQLDEATAAPAGQYDPAGYKVEDVLAYLATASPEEVARVKAAEAATERNSSQIAGFAPKEAPAS